MQCKKIDLFEAYVNFVSLYEQCSKTFARSEKLSPKQTMTLQIIDEYQPLRCSDLAKHMKLSKPTTTDIINRFEKNGYLIKARSPSDGRVIQLKLTTKGQKIARADKMTQMRFVEQIEKSLTQDEIQELISLLNKIQ